MSDSTKAQQAERWLRRLLLLLVLWDFGLAVGTIGFPDFVLRFGRFEPQTEPLWTRGVGMYWGFAGWMQLLAWRSPRRYLAAVQLAVVFRLSASVIDLIEVLWLLPHPYFYFHYLLLFFVVANLAIAGTIIGCLKAMGLPWIEFSPATSTSTRSG